MSHFCLLKDPDGYVAHRWDMLNADKAELEYWLGLFADHFEMTLSCAAHRYGRVSNARIKAAREQFSALVEQIRTDPSSLPSGKLNIIELCRVREQVLRSNDLGDPFDHIKNRENLASMDLYPDVVHSLHSMHGDNKWLHLIESVFAGNMFDLGSPATSHMAHESPDFLTTLEEIAPRPWLVDDFDSLLADLPKSPPPKWTRAVVFIDNAGSDFILGVMPLVRELALEGTQIVLAANELPSLNDMTADDTVQIVEQLAAIDDDLAALIEGQMFEVVSSGNDLPLIDLSDVSDELNEAAADADLVVLEGMGRAVESNFDAAFTVDSIHLALLKDKKVAEHFGGEVFDCVCKYTPAEASE